MNRFSRIVMLCLMLLIVAAPALAADKPAAAPGVASQGGFSIFFGGAFGAGLVIIGAGLGIGRIGAMLGRKFGDPVRPFLLSVRSGARASMPAPRPDISVTVEAVLKPGKKRRS